MTEVRMHFQACQTLPNPNAEGVGPCASTVRGRVSASNKNEHYSCVERERHTAKCELLLQHRESYKVTKRCD